MIGRFSLQSIYSFLLRFARSACVPRQPSPAQTIAWRLANLTALQLLINWAQQDCDWDEAVTRVQIYLDKDQNNADMIYALAGMHFQKGAYTEAELELTRLMAFAPEREDALELKKLIEGKRSNG